MATAAPPLCTTCGRPFEPEAVVLMHDAITVTDLCRVCRAAAAAVPDTFTVGWGQAQWP